MKAALVTLALLSSLAVVCLVGCGPVSPSTDPLVQRDLVRVRVAQLVGDAIHATIGANHAGVITDGVEQEILRVLKAVNDYIRANPTSTKAAILTALTTAQADLPPPLAAQVAPYLATVVAYLGAP